MKRAFDIVAASLGLVVLGLPFLAIAIAIRLDSAGPVFFRQVRIGRSGRPFRIVKFRSMVHGGLPNAGITVTLVDRVTRVGRWLRASKIDELPQLINVLRGQMSLVGPRPLIPHEHQFVNDWGLRRLDLTPGLTGLWQVCGRSEVTFSQMLVLDYLYVTNWSLWGDIKLILRTVPALMGKTRGAM